MRPQSRDALERFAKRIGFVLLFAVILFDLIPFVVFEIIKLVMDPNTPRGEVPHGYPPVDPQLWMTWIPVVVLGVWILATIPVPYRRFPGWGRGVMLISVFLVFIVTAVRVASMIWIPGVASGGTHYIFVVILVLGGLLVARMLLGGLRLLPKSWRVYLDERGHPEPHQKGLPRARRTPLSDIPQ